jgi:hypothetical protein
MSCHHQMLPEILGTLIFGIFIPEFYLFYYTVPRSMRGDCCIRIWWNTAQRNLIITTLSSPAFYHKVFPYLSGFWIVIR